MRGFSSATFQARGSSGELIGLLYDKYGTRRVIGKCPAS